MKVNEPGGDKNANTKIKIVRSSI